VVEIFGRELGWNAQRKEAELKEALAGLKYMK
jgi:hypothetical protein